MHEARFAEARRWHPDLNGNDRQAEERFKLVNEAYAVLSDPKRRRVWEGQDQPGPTNVDPFASGFPSFEDYLDVVLGDGPRRRPRADSPESMDAHDPGFESDDAPGSRWPATAAPPPPPPVQAAESLESHALLTRISSARHGSGAELSDGTVVEVQTPHLPVTTETAAAGVTPGGGDHFSS